MIYLSAGHNKRYKNADPGAVIGNIKEADLTAELRDMVAVQLRLLKANIIVDTDGETLSQYIERIKPGSGSVVCELHFNSSVNLATGTEAIIKNNYNNFEKELALAICNAVSSACGIINRGVKTESQSHRSKLAILHTNAGISVLPEICFINNRCDLHQYYQNKAEVSKKLAELLKQYDDLLN